MVTEMPEQNWYEKMWRDGGNPVKEDWQPPKKAAGGRAARAALMLARPKRALGGTMPYGDSALPIVSDGPPAVGSKPKMLGALPGQPGGGGGGIPGISGGGSGDGNGPGGGEGNGAGGGVGTSAGDAAASASAGVGAGASDAGTGTGTGDSYAAGGKAVRAALMLAKRPKRADGGAVDDQLNKLGYRQDNPAVSRGDTDWLRRNQERAEKSGGKMVSGSTTGYMRHVNVPAKMLSGVGGYLDEDRRPGDEKYDRLSAKVKREGWKPDPIAIAVNHKGVPYITEGNTRTAVANATGQSHVPATIYWMNGAEEVDGPWHPKRIAHRLTVADRPKRADGGAVDDDAPVSISLKRPEQPAVTAFMNEYEGDTHPHPFMRGSRFLNTQTGGDPGGDFAMLDMRAAPYEQKPTVHLSSIMALEPGKGQGKQGLKYVTDLADKHGVHLTGHAKQFGNSQVPTLSTAKLKQWYARNGFGVSKAGDMLRPPGGAPSKTSKPRKSAGGPIGHHLHVTAQAMRDRYADGGGVPLLPERPDVAQYRAMDRDARDAWTRDKNWRSNHPHVVKPGDPKRDANFKAWFGDSKILDKTGEPLRAYHISNKNFTRFIPGGSYDEKEHESGPATWLSPYADKQPAAHHVGGYQGRFRDGTNVTPLHVSMKNPLVLDHRDAMDRAKQIMGDTYTEQFPMLIPASAVRKLREAGHDGIVYAGSNAVRRDEPAYATHALGEHPDREEEIISFDPQRQLKSAIGNNGRYDRSNSDINYADGGAAEAQRPPDAYFNDPSVGSYRPLNFESLVRSGAARITQPGDGRGGHTASDDPEQWSLVSHANDTSPDSVTRSWPDKSASYENAARVLNEPGALYDGKYRQLVWSARQRGMTDKDIYVPSERHPQPRTAYADGGSIGHNGGPTMDAPPAMDAPSDLTQQGLYSQPAFARGGSVDKALRLTRADGGPIPPTAPAPGVSVVPDDHPAVAQAKQILNQPTKARVIKDPEYPISSVIARGVPLNPRNPHPTADQVVAARADDRVGGMAVNKRLDTIVPERERVAGGTYTPGAPGGGRWADATIDVGEAVPTGSDPFPIDTSEYRHESRSEKLVDQPGKGFKITDNELQRLWDASVSESSQAAKNAANAHNVKPTFSAQDWDQAMRLPLRDHLWYELSGEKLAENLPDLTAKQHMKFLDLVGATSARAKPDENLERSLATMSQHMRGVPIDIDLTQPAAVRTALSREGQDTSALPGNKTGHFSDTLALTGGVPTRFPISVNDVWVGKMFGIPDDVMSQNQSLHEPMAKYFNKLRDAYNQRMDPPFQYQSWNFQAPAWVHLRGQQSAAESGDAYHQVWGKTLDKLRRAGVEGIVGDKITKQALMDPKFADALRRTTKPFRDAPKATVEFGSTQTSAGKRAHDLYQTAIARGDDLSQKEYLSGLTTAMYQSGRGKNHPWERLKKALTGDMGVSGDITRIESPTTEAPLDIGGTFEGAVSPNIRVPLKGMSDRKISHFNGIAGKHLRQDAMAVSTVHDAVPDSEPAENATRGHSIFVPTTEGMDPRHIREFAKEMSTQGHDMSYNRYPNGYRFDVLPKFEDSGPVGVTERQLDDAYEKTLQRHYGTGMIAPHDFKSVYNPASDYAGLRKEALGDIRDEFIQQATAAGLTKGAAARAASAKKPPSDLTGRGKRAWDAYRARLDHLAEAEKGFKELAQRVTDAHVKFVGKAEKRFQKPAPTSDPDAPPFARGGVVDPYKHARRVVSTAGRYSRGGGSGKTDERSVVDRALQLTSKGYRK